MARADRLARARTILSQRAMERSGTPDRWPTSSAVSIRRPGSFGNIRLKTTKSGPHGLVSDASGNIWFTASFKGYVGKLDPMTGDIREFPLPDPKARDPHTPVFDQKGILWFTVIGGNMIGRLDPVTGEIKLVLSPTADSLPYGLAGEFEGRAVLRRVRLEQDRTRRSRDDADRRNMSCQIRRRGLGGSRSTSDDLIWYSDYARGYLGRLDPKTGKVTEWPSPGGRESGPYAITAVDDVIWYCRVGEHAEHAGALRSED